MNYERIYNQLIERAVLRGSPDEYYEKHHIVPSSLGGSNDESNLVRLTLKEHLLAHLLLYRMLGGDTIFSVECFFHHTRHKYFDIHTMPRWIRKAITVRRAQLKREMRWKIKSI